MESGSYQATDRTTPSRLAERAAYDADTVHAILDGCMVAHLGYVADERPQILPVLYLRVGRALYFHGSTGAHPFRMAARQGSLPVVAEVTMFDELVLARSSFHHSVNYRSVVAHGSASLVRDEDRKASILAALVERLVPGRGTDARPAAADELRQTAVLELPLEEVSAKVRRGGPADDEADLSSSCWAGVWPIHSSYGQPRPADDLGTGIDVPPYLREGTPVAFPV